jgi:hypothetical protein
MRINHAWREHQAGPINHALVGTRRDCPNLDDRIAYESDIGGAQRCAGAVGELGATDRPARGSSLSFSRNAERRAGEQQQQESGHLTDHSGSVCEADE